MQILNSTKWRTKKNIAQLTEELVGYGCIKGTHVHWARIVYLVFLFISEILKCEHTNNIRSLF